MTTKLEMRKFFVYGVENAEGKTFRGIKEATLATSVASDVVKFYCGIGFGKVVATNCNDAVFIKDCNDRLLAFVTDEVNLKADDGSKEYRTAYWAWKEVNRQADAVAEKAAAKVNTKTNEGREVATDKKENATIKGSIEVGAPQKKPWYYAVRKGREVGIFTDWAEAEASVKGFSDPKFKKFRALKDAQEFVEGGDNE